MNRSTDVWSKKSDDTNPPRIAPHHLIDLGIGFDALKVGKVPLRARITVVNLFNTVALYNFLSTFAGTHFVTPRAVQTELVRLSYLQDTPDGVMGGHTRSAISNYERANGMAVDASASPKLLAKLQGTPTGAVAATASAPSGWVAPAQQGKVVPASATAPAAPSNWVAPTKTP